MTPIYDDLVIEWTEKHGDPMRGGIPFEDWEGLVPPPSIHELIDTLSGGNQFLKEASGEFAWAERTLRRIAAKDDTEMIPVITDDGGEPNG